MRFFSTLIFAFIFSSLTGQMPQEDGTILYGNEWINVDQEYYKFKIGSDGVYRLNYADLINAGIPVESISIDDFSLHRLGEEVAINFNKESGVLEAGDYIEFFAQKLEREFNSTLFEDSEVDPLNPYANIISDTVSYFLSWSEGLHIRNQEITTSQDISKPNSSTFYAKRSEVSGDRLYKSYDFDPASYPSHFRSNDGFYLLPTRNYFLSDYSLPNFDASSSKDVTLEFKVLNRVDTVQLAIIFNADTVFSQELLPLELLDTTFTIDSEVNASNDIRFRNLLNNKNFNLIYHRLSYPMKLNSVNRVFEISDQELIESNYKFYPEENQNLKIYFSDTTAFIEVENTLDSVALDLQFAIGNRKMAVMSNADSIREITALERVEFPVLATEESNYVIISSRRLFNNDESSLRAYQAYRESVMGGEYQVSLVYYEDLENLFGYGVPRNFLAIKNYLNWLDEKDKSPDYTFIIGKGRSFRDWRFEEDINNDLFTSAFIPTYGFPGSDMMLSSPGNVLDTAVTIIGRLPISRPEQLDPYLKKLQQFDSLRFVKNLTVEDAGWINKIMHLGGGNSEQASIQQYLKSLEDIMKNPSWNADVESYFKSSPDPIQNAQSEELKESINNGVSIITFFGHSSIGSFDFKLEDPKSYRPEGKYPVMYSMGCINGDIHSVITGLAEQFVLEDEAGSIAFLGSSGNGFLGTLFSLARSHYSILSDSTNARLGDLQRQVNNNIMSGASQGLRILIEQFTLTGDPAIEIGPLRGKDYTLSLSETSLSSSIIAIEDNNIELDYTIHNLRAFEKDTIVVDYSVEQNGNLFLLKRDSIELSSSKQLISATLDIPEGIKTGSARLNIELDPENAISEFPNPGAESNNILGFEVGESGLDVIFVEGQLEFLSPLEYSISISDEPKIILQSEKVFSGVVDYIFELDTTSAFISPLVSESLVSFGGSIQWEPNFLWEYNRVYYIRARLDKANSAWTATSFVHRPNDNYGWNQSHVDQWSTLKTFGLQRDLSGDFDFQSVFNEYNIRNLFLVNNGSSPPEITLNLGRVAASFNPNGILIVVVEDEFFLPRTNIDRDYGSTGTNFFYWSAPDTTKRKQVMSFLEEKVEIGDYVFFLPIRKAEDTINFRIDEWAQDSVYFGQNLFQKLEEEGATEIRGLVSNPRPYILVYRKGFGRQREVVGTDFFDDIRITETYELPSDSGGIQSIAIGPAQKFNSIDLKWKSDFDSLDLVDLKIPIFDESNNRDTLIYQDLTPSYFNQINYQDTFDREFVNLNIELLDSTRFTAPDAEYLRVYYQAYPEFHFNSELEFSYEPIVLISDTFQLKFNVGNYSFANSDSLKVRYTWTDEDNLSQSRDRVFAKFDSLEIKELAFSISDFNLPGEYRLLIELNPDLHQGELVRNNNFAEVPFKVDISQSQVQLDIKFNSKTLDYGSFVSAEQIVSINLIDLLPQSELLDSSALTISLKEAGSADYQHITYASSKLNFLNGELPFNLAGAELLLDLQVEGTYSLKVNASAPKVELEREIEFNFTKTSNLLLSNVYPNPASRFVNLDFEFYGETIPDKLNLTLWNVSGQKLGATNLLELHPLDQGLNNWFIDLGEITFSGNELPAGVYTYKLQTVFNDSSFLNSENQALLIIQP